MHHSHRTLRTDDQDFKHAVEEALQWVEDAEQLPKLSLFQGDDEDGSSDRLFDMPACGDESSVEDLVLLHGESGEDGTNSESAASSRGVATQVDLPDMDPSFPVGDHSATQDLILCEPPEANDRMLQLALGGDNLPEEPEAATEAEDAEESEPALEQNLPFRPVPTKKTHPLRPGKTPDRIGHGKLVSARLTWKPGDPFGDGKPRPVERFSWESMLTSACITAACGLFCVWLLRSILA